MSAAVDSGGGRSTSTNHVVTSCLGSEIAGSQSSSNYRIDSGCGATVLFVPAARPPVVVGPATPVPGLTDAGFALLVAMLAAMAARRLRHRLR